MNPIVKIMLRRFLLTLSGILVWVGLLKSGSADQETQSISEMEEKPAEDRQPNRKPQ